MYRVDGSPDWLRKKGLIIGASVSLGAAIAMGTLASFGALNRTESWVYPLAGLLLSLTVLPAVFAAARRDFDVFEPIHMFSALFAIYFGLRALYVATDFGQLLPVQVSPYPYADYIPLALGYTILGYLALMAGYYSGIPASIAGALPRLTLKWPASLQPGKISFIFGLGLLATLYQISQGRLVGADPRYNGEVGEATFLILSLLHFTFYATGIAAIYIIRGKAPTSLKLLFGGVMIPAAVIQAFLFGGKSYVYIVLFAVAVAYNYVKRRISPAQIVVVALSGTLIVSPFVNIYRGEIMGSVGGSARSASEVVRNLGDTLDRFIDYDLPTYLRLAGEMIASRLHGIDSLALIIKYHAQTADLRFRLDYLLIPAYAFLPRVVWPGKPTGHSIEFGRALFVSPSVASDSYVSIGMFHIGDLYINFGPAGITIGMFILGIFYRTIYAYLRPGIDSEPLRIFLYTFLMWPIVSGFEAEIPQLYSGLLKTILFLLVIGWFVKEGARGPKAT